MFPRRRLIPFVKVRFARIIYHDNLFLRNQDKGVLWPWAMIAKNAQLAVIDHCPSRISKYRLKRSFVNGGIRKS